jgi:hypothetical protein
MARKIRLTESEFHSLVRRLVREAQDEMMSADFEDINGNEEFNYEEEDFDQEGGNSKEEKEKDVQALADYFASEILPELRPRDLDRLEAAAEDLDPDTILSESEEEYSPEDRRKDMRKGKMYQAGAAAAGIPAALGFVSYIPGYVDFPNTLLKAHELFEQLSLGEYTGPVMFGMVVAAVVAALKGSYHKDMAKTGKRY